MFIFFAEYFDIDTTFFCLAEWKILEVFFTTEGYTLIIFRKPACILYLRKIRFIYLFLMKYCDAF